MEQVMSDGAHGMDEIPSSGDIMAEQEEAALRAALSGDGVKLCAHCGIRPPRPRAHPTKGVQPIYCEECNALGKSKRQAQKRQEAPGTVKIDLGLGKTGAPSRKDKDFQLVEARAQQMAQMVSAMLLMVGQAEDSRDVSNGSRDWAHSVAGLAPYEPWLVKLCQGGEASGRVMAWVVVVMATVGLSMPVLLRHGIIPEGPLRDAFAGMAAMAEAVPA